MVTRCFFILLSIVLVSCSPKNYKSIDNSNSIFWQAYNNYHDKQDSIYKIDYEGRMSMYIRAYINSYFKQPKNINELYHAFDRLDLEGMKQIYELQYRLMEEYKDDIKVFAGDSVTALFYKQIIPENVIAVTGTTEVEHNMGYSFDMLYSYFDKDGYLLGDSLTQQALIKEYRQIALKYNEYKNWKSDTEYPIFKKYIFIEYESTVFRNAETKEAIPIEKWAYFKEIKEWMERKCKEYGFSRLIIPCLIPKDF